MAQINQPAVGRYIDPLSDFGFKRLFASISYLADVWAPASMGKMLPKRVAG